MQQGYAYNLKGSPGGQGVNGTDTAQRMFLAHKLGESLKRTMDKTDVWGGHNYPYRLAGSGKDGHASKALKENMAQQL
jgi:hypothetical protein